MKTKIRKIRCQKCKEELDKTKTTAFIDGHKVCQKCFFRSKSCNHKKHFYNKHEARRQRCLMWID